MSDLGIFSNIAAFSRATRKIKFANPDDIISSKEEYSAFQLSLPESERGRPNIILELRPDAPVIEVEICRLRSNTRLAADAILDAAMPPPLFQEEPPASLGAPPRRLQQGYDDEHPDYLAERRKLEYKQAAFVTLHGVVGLLEATPGDTEDKKLAALRAEWDDSILRYLSRGIWNMTYSAGDPADFFTKGS